MHGRGARFVLLLVVAVGWLGGARSAQAGPIRPDPELTASVDAGGTGALVGAVRTAAVREGVPAGRAPRILILGTGVQRSLFPAALQSAIVASGSDASDPHGYGTLAASAMLQLLPDATLVSKRVRPLDTNWQLIDLDALASALSDAREARDTFDAVLLAFPPQAALDPITYAIGYLNYGKHGRGMAMIEEALLSTRVATDGPVAGIPLDPDLRARMLARANLRQRDAVERFTAHAARWRGVVAALDALVGAGAPVVAPAGDFAMRARGELRPLVTQTVFGLSALPNVITVGASYLADGSERVSPTSGRGPTLSLAPKPDLLAPADVLAMLPADARLGWPDDSARAPLRGLEWARPGVAPTACPSIAGAYRCVLQGSSIVSAAVAAANVAAFARGGVDAGADTAAVARGIATAAASRTPAVDASGRRAPAWEQGAGVLEGLEGIRADQVPVVLAPVTHPEARWDRSARIEVPLWDGGAAVRAARASLTDFAGPSTTGATRVLPYADAARVTAAPVPGGIALDISAERVQGGVYAGLLAVETAAGEIVEVPFGFTQAVPLDFHVNHAYNEFQTGAEQGERVEDSSLVLFAGLPQNVGIVGAAFKNFSSTQFRRFGGDPTNSVVIRTATTRNSFTDASVSPEDHGRGRVEAVPPGFYRMHVLTDHAVGAVQARGRDEELGIKLATSGPEAATTPGANLLIPSCASSSPLKGPMGCAAEHPADPEIDKNTGLCVARNATAQVAFAVYCGEIAYATPAAFVSRAIHQIEHARDPARSEWTTCGVDLPLDGSELDLGAIVARARDCTGPTAPTAWTLRAGAPACVAPSERAAPPPSDLTATYAGPSAPARNLPVAVLTYRFALPHLNTYTTAGLTLSYSVRNALIAVRFDTGEDPAADASHGLLVASAPDVRVDPPVAAAGARGTAFDEWAVMSANAAVGRISLILIPTVWPDPSEPLAPAAEVSLCDVALRVQTFAKQGWGLPQGERQRVPVLDRGLVAQVDPAKTRMRAAWDGSRFVDAGVEREDLVFATQIPKNTTMDRRVRRHVRSPVGGPARLTDARRWGTDARAHESILDPGFRVVDPAHGTTRLACAENAADPAAAEVCRAWNVARAAHRTLAALTPELSLNGRTDGVLAVDHAAIARAAGNVAFEIARDDDAGVFEAAGRWHGARVPVSDYYDDIARPLTFTMLSATLAIVRDPADDRVLRMALHGGSARARVLSTRL